MQIYGYTILQYMYLCTYPRKNW